MHLQGSTAFVTGGAQGLGRAFCEALLSQGASVCFCDVQEQTGKVSEQELQAKYGTDKAMFRPCDVRSEEEFSKVFNEAVSKFGHIDLMMNNAGIGGESRVRDMIEINLFGVIKGSQLAIEHMRKDKGGRGGVIINMASGAGLSPVYLFPVYSATKSGVLGYTQSLSSNPHIEVSGIQFACLCPGFADTALLKVNDYDCLYPGDIQGLYEEAGITTVDEVTKAFMQIVQSDNCNGDVVTVAKHTGVQYVKKNGAPVDVSPSADDQ